MKRPALLLPLLAALCLLAAGCAGLTEPEPPVESWDGYQQPPAEDAAPEEAGEDYPAAFSLPYHKDQTLDPILCGEGVQETVSSLLYEPLFRLDGSFEPVPLLCESWQWDAAGLVCTLDLRQDVFFSDGSPLTARDVAETLLRAKESARYGYRLRNVTSVAANRAGQVVLTLASPNRGLPALLDIPIVKRETAGASVPIGTGPYRLSGDGNGSRLTASPDWWQHKPLPVEDIPLIHAKDRDTALYLFSSHRVELLTADPTNDPGFVTGQAQTAEQPTAILQFVGFNTAEGRLFSSAACRMAFSRGIDRETLVDAQLVRLALPAQFPLSPLSSLYPHSLERTYSEEDALAALRSAGQDSGEQKSLKLLVSGDDSFRVDTARYLAQAMSLLDWEITVEALPWEDYLAALEAGEFDLYFGEVRLTADWDLTDLIGAGGAMNYGGYANEGTDALLLAFAAAEDRQEAALRLMTHLQYTAPIAPVCFKNYEVLTHPGVVEGLSPHPSDTFHGLDRWTIRLSPRPAAEE